MRRNALQQVSTVTENRLDGSSDCTLALSQETAQAGLRVVLVFVSPLRLEGCGKGPSLMARE